MNIEKVVGSHAECGEQVGKKFGKHIYRSVVEMKESGMPGMTWEQVIDLTKRYWDATEEAYPFAVEEIAGVAKGAGVEPLDLFAYMVEEIWADPVLEAKACSDIVATAPKTDGRIIIGHNNDLSEAMGKIIFPVERNFDDGTKMLTVGPLGFYVSVGVNSHGIALTGNEVTPTDNKIGVPRSIIARSILSARSIDEAIKIATDERRASSYNNIISTKNKVVDVEGSGTAFELSEPVDGFLVHTNHYACKSMQKFEGKSGYKSSIDRMAHGQKMIQGRSHVTAEEMAMMLADHNGGEGDDNSICRHGDKSISTFGIIIDFGDSSVRLVMGNPCKGKFEKVWSF